MTFKSSAVALSIACSALVGLQSAGHAQETQYNVCGPLTSGYGPFDYRFAAQKDKYLVESAHFTPWVENLTRGNTSSTPAGDIAYTLRAFPNHPRALLSMMKLAEREKRDKPRGSTYTMDCWFERAIRFQPEDGTVRMLYGTYLARKNKDREAIEQLELADKLITDDANVHYNLGLAYFDVKQYDKALTHAKKAYALGFQLPGLRDMLKRAGKWTD